MLWSCASQLSITLELAASYALESLQYERKPLHEDLTVIEKKSEKM